MKYLIPIIVLLLLFTACTTEQPTNEQNNLPVLNAVTNADNAPTNNEMKEITMTIRRNVIEPATINLNTGDKVRLDIVNDQENFAFTIPGIEVEEISYANGMIYYEFTANNPGVYNMVCTSGCVGSATELDSLIIVE